MHGDYTMPGGYMHYENSITSRGSETSGGSKTSGGSLQFDDPDLDDEFFAFSVIRKVDFSGHVGRIPETRPDHKDYKGVQFEPGMKAKGITVIKTPNSMIG